MRMTGWLAYGLVLVAGSLTGCSQECNTSAAAPPHVLVNAPSSFTDHPGSVATVCAGKKCVDLEPGARGSIDVQKGENEVLLSVTVTANGREWSQKSITAPLHEQGNAPAACGKTPSNIVGAISISPAGSVKNVSP
jgi:hypothetical protein